MVENYLVNSTNVQFPVNSNPKAINDAYTIKENDPTTTLYVLVNDVDYPDSGEILVVTSVTSLLCVEGFTGASSSNSVNVTSSTESVFFTPSLYFWGSCTFLYSISDGNGGTSVGSVTVTIAHGIIFSPLFFIFFANNLPYTVNQNPTVIKDVFTINENSPSHFDVLANDTSFPDVGEALSISAVSSVSCTDGRNSATSFSFANATIVNAGIDFTTLQYFWGTCAFTYTVSDGNGGSATAPVLVMVNNGKYCAA